MRAARSRFASIAVAAEERRLAGLISGVLYLMGAVTLAALTILPGVTHVHSTMVLALACVTGIWGFCSLRAIDWDRAPVWLIHLSNLAGLAIIAMSVASTGGAESPAWTYLFLPAVFAAYFYRRPVAFVYLGGCVAVNALPPLYDPRALHDAFLAGLVIAAPAYLVIGSTIAAGKAPTSQLRDRAEQLACEQGALRRVATAVVGGEAPERIYELVASEAAAMLRGDAAGILRLEDPQTATVTGTWGAERDGRYEPGTVVSIRPGSDLDAAIQSERAVRVDAHPPASPVERLGYRSSVVTPVRVFGRTWGVLVVTAVPRAWFTAEDEERLTEFGNLLATAIASIEDRAKLAAQASSDPLTGLANHRFLQQRLFAEAARALRHGSP